MGKSQNIKEEDILEHCDEDIELYKLNGMMAPRGDDDEEENIEDFCDDFVIPPFCKCCGKEMRFSLAKLKFMCPNCRHVLYLDEYVFDEDSADYCDYYQDIQEEIPNSCKACGGPYPDCRSSCKIFDD